MTQPAPDFEAMAREYGNKIALPMIRSMYPSISRTEMAHHLTAAFRAGQQAGLLEAAKIADGFEERKWLTLREGGDISECSPRYVAAAIRAASLEGST